MRYSPEDPENPELPEPPDFPEQVEEETPVLLEDYDEQRPLDEHPGDDLEELRERRELGAAEEANEADATEQIRSVPLDEDDYRD